MHTLLKSKIYAILKKRATVHEIIVRDKEAYLARDRYLADSFCVVAQLRPQYRRCAIYPATRSGTRVDYLPRLKLTQYTRAFP